VRRGVRPDGASLYPAMPFPSYARLTDADLQALYAYFTHGVRPAAQPDAAPDIPWPLSLRWPLTYWRWLFAPPVGGDADGAPGDPALARGAYLVEGPGHCGACHTSRGLGLEEKALSPRDGDPYLAGGGVDRYVAGDLRGDPLTGLGAWSEDDIVQFLKTGRNQRAAAFAGMADVVAHSAEFMTDDDLRAIAHFLKSLPGARGEKPLSADRAVGAALASGDAAAPGALDYLNNCAACRRPSGRGYREIFPALAGDPVVNGVDPSRLIATVLNGGAVPASAGLPSRYFMPAFANRLTDQETADILTFVRSSWGNRAPRATAEQVAALRRATGAPAPPRR
jgi:mono/diheme cytochrome c family protein